MHKISFQFIFTLMTIIIFTHKIKASPPVVLWHGMGEKIIIIYSLSVLKFRYNVLLY